MPPPKVTYFLLEIFKYRNNNNFIFSHSSVFLDGCRPGSDGELVLFWQQRDRARPLSRFLRALLHMAVKFRCCWWHLQRWFSMHLLHMVPLMIHLWRKKLCKFFFFFCFRSFVSSVLLCHICWIKSSVDREINSICLYWSNQLPTNLLEPGLELSYQ